MYRFIGKRLLMMIPIIIGISFLIFLIMDLTPGDAASASLGASATQEEIAELREELGLNDSILVQYFRYIKGAVRGDFGISYRTKSDLWLEIGPRIPVTINLAFWAMIIMVCVAVPIGIISAVKQYSIPDRVITVLSTLMTSMPTFWLGLMLMVVFALKLGLLPSIGIGSWKHFILPAITSAIAMTASLVRMTRSNMLEVIRSDYIRTARAKGASEGSVIMNHALRNALLPVITLIGLDFGGMLGGAMATESVFSIPGLGTLLITSVRCKDSPTVVTIVVLAAISISVVNLLVDILYAFIDPRIRSQYAKS